MTDIYVGSVAVGVVPDARGWDENMRRQILPGSRQIGDEAGAEMGKAIASKMGAAGDESASKFEQEFKRRLKLALDSLPKAKIDADVTEIDAKLEGIRLQIESISSMSIIDTDRASRDIARIAGELRALRLF